MRRIALLLTVSFLLLVGCEAPTYQGLSSINAPPSDTGPTSAPTFFAPTATSGDVYNEPTPMTFRTLGWHYFTPSDRSFTIALQGTVTESHTSQTESGFAVEMNTYVAVYYGITYGVVRGQFPAGTMLIFSDDGKSQLLDKALTGMASGGGAISNKRVIMVADYVSIGHPAVMATVTKNKIATDALIFFFGDSLYILGISHPAGKEVDAETFFSSFHTLAPPA